VDCLQAGGKHNVLEGRVVGHDLLEDSQVFTALGIVVRTPTILNHAAIGYNRFGNSNVSAFFMQDWPQKIGMQNVPGTHFPTLVVVIGLSGWVSYARILRSQVLVLRGREFVEAIRALGGSTVRVVLRHVLPNVLASLVVVATLELARAIVLEATLSFLGLGIQPPTPSWGGMIQEGRDYLDSAWWISTAPGVVLMITSIVISRAGDWLRDVLDPTLRGE